jgi:hypothetical protein
MRPFEGLGIVFIHISLSPYILFIFFLNSRLFCGLYIYTRCFVLILVLLSYIYIYIYIYIYDIVLDFIISNFIHILFLDDTELFPMMLQNHANADNSMIDPFFIHLLRETYKL